MANRPLDSQENDVEDLFQITINDDHKQKFRRLDQLLADLVPGLSRTAIKRLFESEQISSESKLSLNKLPNIGTIIDVHIPPPIPLEAQAEDIPLEILFEDEHLIIINKQAGMVTHPAPGNYSGTLVNAILHHCPDLKGIGGVKRPGIVHRLDKGTSGVMVVAKSQKAHEELIVMFSKHDIDRYYEALAIGQFKQHAGKIESPIARNPNNRLKMKSGIASGKNAITFFKVIKQFSSFTHVELKLETGRTHQIRVHLSQNLGHAILCDSTYGNPKQQMQRLSTELVEHLNEYPYPLLHAKTLGFVHPITNEKISFTTNPPDIFTQTLSIAEKLS